MDARPITVGNILHATEQYIIPFFQRRYSWEKPHWDRLRKDIWALMEDGNDKVHFLGPLVCTRTPHFPTGVPAFQLIDGQQRLTTLTLLLAAIRDVASSRGLKVFAQEVSEEYLLNKYKQDTERYKVLPRLEDREALKVIVEGQDISPFTESNVVHALRYFRRYTEHWARQDSENQLRKLLVTVTGRLQLVVVTIDSENPYAIFESLNATGLPLAESDLIRNFIFMQIPVDKQQEFHDRHWKGLEEKFSAAKPEETVPMTPFYRDYLMRDGQYSKEKSTFTDFKKHQTDAKLTPEQQVEELTHFASLDLMLCRPKTVKRDNLRRLLCQVEGMEISTAFPLILNLLERNACGQLSETDLDGCLLDLVSFVLRRSICGESTRQYNKWFIEAITVIKENPRQDLEQYWLRRRWPDDATVKQRLPDFPLYHRESRKARVILEAIEENYGHKEKVELDGLSIEHVMPQSIGGNAAGRSWKTMLGDDWEAVHETLLHTIGNLTLTGYNPDLSNSGFDRKKELLTESNLQLNRYFDGITTWTADAIKARSVKLADIVTSIWPRSPSAEGYIASPEAQPEPEGLSSMEQKHLEYWRHLDTRLEDRGIPPEVMTPSTKSSINLTIGKTRSMVLQLGLWRHNNLYVSLFPVGEVGEVIFKQIQQQKSAVESAIGYALKWKDDDPEILVTDDDVFWTDKEDWPVQHDWFGDRFEDFRRVFSGMVERYEQEALRDPGLASKVEQKERLTNYWTACAELLKGSEVAFRANELERGRNYCRFESIETGISFGAYIGKKNSTVEIYFGVQKSAGRKMRSLFLDLVERYLAELQTALGVQIGWSDPYLSAWIKADVENRDDWPRQHEWIRSTACKVISEFKKRLQL